MTLQTIKTDKYYLLTSDEEINRDDYIVCINSGVNHNKIVRVTKPFPKNNGWVKIIGHFPFKGVRLPENPLLPSPDDVIMMETSRHFSQQFLWPQPKIYTEEQVRDAITMAREQGYQRDFYGTYFAEKYTPDEIIKSLSPVEKEMKLVFEPMMDDWFPQDSNSIFRFKLIHNPKHPSNPIIQGKWIVK